MAPAAGCASQDLKGKDDERNPKSREAEKKEKNMKSRDLSQLSPTCICLFFSYCVWSIYLFKHVSGLAGLGEHVFITAIGLNQRMFWLK